MMRRMAMAGHEPTSEQVPHDKVESSFDRAIRFTLWERMMHAALDVLACLGYIFK